MKDLIKRQWEKFLDSFKDTHVCRCGFTCNSSFDMYTHTQMCRFTTRVHEKRLTKLRFGIKALL